MKMAIWLSYDLGIDGDYMNLFHWLDSKEAKECVGNFSFFYYEYEKNILDEIKRDLSAAMNLRLQDRIYIVRVENGKSIGSFIKGQRKVAPWLGYAAKTVGSGQDE